MLALDGHVHIVGDGTAASGCEVKLTTFWQRQLSRFMLKELDLPEKTLGERLDRAYANRLLEWVRESDLSHVVILANERTYLDSGEVLHGFGSLFVPNDFVLRLGRESSEFLPAVSIHPARADAIEELERCAAAGAVMLKLLPNCHNVDCSRAEYRPFWEKLAQLGLPFLAHTGGELALPVYEKKYQDPACLRLPLECGVNVIAAHAGSPSLPWEKSYLKTVAEMIPQYSNLYIDNSGMLTPLRSFFLGKLLKEPFRSRVIHGSDIPIPISARWLPLYRLLSREKARFADTIKNTIERDRYIKAEMGFPEESFRRLARLLPPVKK